MTRAAPEDYEMFRIENIAFDVGQIFGATTDQGIARARRCVYRAALYIAGQNRRWKWLKTKDSFLTIASTQEYSLRDDVKVLHQMWMEGATRGVIHRIPTTEKVRRITSPSETSGNPYLFDEEGVDSSGAPVISLWPVPASAIEVFYRFTRDILPPTDPSDEIMSYWGMPRRMLEPLTQKAAALCIEGVNSVRFDKLNGLAEALIEDAYAADQESTLTTFRAPMNGGRGDVYGDVQLPPQFDRE